MPRVPGWGLVSWDERCGLGDGELGERRPLVFVISLTRYLLCNDPPIYQLSQPSKLATLESYCSRLSLEM